MNVMVPVGVPAVVPIDAVNVTVGQQATGLARRSNVDQLQLRSVTVPERRQTVCVPSEIIAANVVPVRLGIVRM